MLYRKYNLFDYTILFGLYKSSKITLFKDQVGKLVKAKCAENDFFDALFRLFKLKYLQVKMWMLFIPGHINQGITVLLLSGKNRTHLFVMIITLEFLGRFLGF